MRVPAAAMALIVTAFSGVPGPSFGGGFGEPPGDRSVTYGEVKFEPLRLPLSAKAARTWISLRETLVTPPPDATPFKDVLRFVKESTRGKDGKGEPLGVYLDAVTVQEAELTMETPVAAPLLLGQGEVPLHTYLKLVLKPLGLTHWVHDGLVVIDSPCDDCPEPAEISAGYAWAWLLLHEEIPLHFPEGTTLGDALQTIQRATAGKRPGGRGLTIYLDPVGLRAAEKSPASPVTFEIDQAPLCTSLGLLLKAEGLLFVVGDDGLVTVTDENGLNDFMDEADVVERYEHLRYDFFWQMEQRAREDERRKTSEVRAPGSRGGGKDCPVAKRTNVLGTTPGASASDESRARTNEATCPAPSRGRHGAVAAPARCFRAGGAVESPALLGRGRPWPHAGGGGGRRAETPPREGGITARQAVRIAERFVRENGYTDFMPEDPRRLTPESIEFSRDPRGWLKVRRNELKPQAVGYRKGSRIDPEGWTVGFALVKPIDAARPVGRAVTLDARGRRAQVEHMGFYLDHLEPRPD